jgi:threonine dehydratase
VTASPRIPSTLDVVRARRRLASHLAPSPLRRSEWMSAHARADVRLKLEVVQPGGSFKIRGALNALLALSGSDGVRAEARRVIAASAGNHGRALALAARATEMEALVFTPATAPVTKKAAIRALGAGLNDDAADYDAAERAGRAAAEREGVRFVSPYNDADVIAGAGTIGLEIAEQMPDVDTVVVPLGGGGLASGLGLALDAAAPRARIVGVEVEASTPFTASLSAGRIVRITARPTLADGLAGNLEPDAITFGLVRQLVDDVVVVTEDELRHAMRRLLADEHLVAEGAGAAATAAVLAGRVPGMGQRVAVMLTGGNVDERVVKDVLAADDRI